MHPQLYSIVMHTTICIYHHIVVMHTTICIYHYIVVMHTTICIYHYIVVMHLIFIISIIWVFLIHISFENADAILGYFHFEHFSLLIRRFYVFLFHKTTIIEESDHCIYYFDLQSIEKLPHNLNIYL